MGQDRDDVHAAPTPNPPPPESSAPISSTPVSSRVLVGAALALIAGGVVAAFLMQAAKARPFDLIDLAVYRAAGKAVLHGESVYGDYVADQLRIRLPFIYPPIAAVLAIPFTLLGPTAANIVYTALSVALLAGVVRVCFAPLLARYPRSWFAFALVLLAALAVSPVEDHLRFGQVGIPLMAACVFDCAVEKPKWPRGLLVGLATAMKLVPGIFIPYFVLTRRWRAAGVASVTFLIASFAGLVITPSGSKEFWTDKMFEPTSPTFFSNQSLEGILERAIGPWRLIWIPAVLFAFAFGLWRAAAASRRGEELRGIAIVGVASLLISPISWVHHMVWIVPALAVIVGRADDRRRVALAFVVAALFIARLPYIGGETLGGNGFVAGLVTDIYGLIAIGLFLLLTDTFGLWRRLCGAPTAESAPATT